MASSVGSLGLPSPTAARTPDTPSFVFFDSDNVVTPPAVNSATEASKAPFGLPTPPHSASSARSGYPGLPKPPSSPSLAHKESLNAASSAAYRSRILVLEKQIAVLQARLASAGQAGASVEIAEQSDLEAMSKAAGKVSAPQPNRATRADRVLDLQACDKCGCSCRNGASQSVLSRPRAVIGNGNSFSSARRD